MRHPSARPAGVIVLCLVLLALAGCAEKTPEQKLVEARSLYTATLNGWTVLEPAAEESISQQEETPLAADAAAADLADEATIGSEATVAETGPQPKTVLLDILIKHQSRDKLAGITLDIGLADATGAEKRHWRAWVDTSKIERGPGIQIDYRLDDVEIVDGDGFHVEVRSSVSAADRAEYREFAELP